MANSFFGNPFWNYWSLTFAVFLIFLFSFIVAGMDVREEIAEALRKAQTKRGRAKPRFTDPLADRSVAATLDPGANRQLPPHLQWVYDRVVPIARRLGIEARVLVYEDSKSHPLIHVTDGKRLISYRLDKTLAQEARSGDADKLAEADRRIEAFLRLEWLGDETAMRRTTELAKEAARSAAKAQTRATPDAGTAQGPESEAARVGAAEQEGKAASAADPRAAERQRIIEEARARAAARRAQKEGDS
ncbi:MAG: hypothetical protein QN163_07120 [Armatimonadota bacterium]|nr:hypothetical protein [Armatimonadota bacterium]MDR5696473.1 hypothetical protein [Armatimonadota bacterium]